MQPKGHVKIQNSTADPNVQHPENHKVEFDSDKHYEIHFQDSTVFGTGDAHLNPGNNPFQVKVATGSTAYEVKVSSVGSTTAPTAAAFQATPKPNVPIGNIIVP